MALFGVEVAAILGTVAVGGAGMALSPLLFGGSVGAAPHPVGMAVLALPLFAIAGVRLLLRLTAAFEAWRGETWALPVLGRWTRRWLPPPAA